MPASLQVAFGNGSDALSLDPGQDAEDNDDDPCDVPNAARRKQLPDERAFGKVIANS
jgi:hypothetical protein